MTRHTIAAVLFMCGLPTLAAFAPGVSATAADHATMAQTEAMPSKTVTALAPAARSWLEPLEHNTRDLRASCKGRRVYSAHDVVGDPQACFKNNFIVGGGSF
ncbi:MAG: hypothetical protein ACREQX_01170 [Candidatus Binataceae bacterium]